MGSRARALADLPVRNVLELVYRNELDLPAIAHQLGASLNTAYSRLQRARLMLRAALKGRADRASEGA